MSQKMELRGRGNKAAFPSATVRRRASETPPARLLLTGARSGVNGKNHGRGILRHRRHAESGEFTASAGRNSRCHRLLFFKRDLHAQIAGGDG